MGLRAMRRKSPPVILGHTAIGVVETVGSGVSDLRAGQRVIVSATPQCGACFYCLAGRPDQCSVLMDGSDPIVADLPDGRERSEEHTSELQSLMAISYAGFCLKKKK